MTDLERLKQAEEAEPMAVLVDILPDDCWYCRWVESQNGTDECIITGEKAYNRSARNGKRPEHCPYKVAIGIIEPNGHVVYLREEEK